MENSLKKFKLLFSLMVLGAIYGGAIGAGLALLTGNNAVALALAGSGLGSGAGSIALAWGDIKAGANAGSETNAWSKTNVWSFAGFALLVGLTAVMLTNIRSVFIDGLVPVVSGYLHTLAQRNNTTLEGLVEKHIVWIFSLPITIFRLFSGAQSSVKKSQKSETKQRALDVSLIITFSQGLAEVFPEDWNNWQHWISDMMDSRTRMQSKGINHPLVSLITFYRLTRFAFHIGIDKVFILATRRTTR